MLSCKSIQDLPPEVIATAIRFSLLGNNLTGYLSPTASSTSATRHLSRLMRVSRMFLKLTAPILYETLSMDRLSLSSTKNCLETLIRGTMFDYGAHVLHAKLFVNVDLERNSATSCNGYGVPPSMILTWISAFRRSCKNLRSLELDMAMFVYGGWNVDDNSRETLKQFVGMVDFPRLKEMRLVNWDIRDAEKSILIKRNVTILNLAHISISDEHFEIALKSIGKNLISLTLDHTQKLTSKCVIAVLRYCPNLESLLLTDTSWPILIDSSNLTIVPVEQQHYHLHEFANALEYNWSIENENQEDDVVLHPSRINFITELKNLPQHTNLRHLKLRASPPGTILEIQAFRILLMKILNNLETLAVSHHYGTTIYMKSIIDMIKMQKIKPGNILLKTLKIGFLTGEEVLGFGMCNERQVLERLHVESDLIKSLLLGPYSLESLEMFEVEYVSAVKILGWEDLMNGRYGLPPGVVKVSLSNDEDDDEDDYL